MCIRDRLIAGVFVGNLHLRQLDNAEIAETTQPFLIFGYTPVSYTHLDVYKRQAVSVCP